MAAGFEFFLFMEPFETVIPSVNKKKPARPNGPKRGFLKAASIQQSQLKLAAYSLPGGGEYLPKAMLIAINTSLTFTFRSKCMSPLVTELPELPPPDGGAGGSNKYKNELLKLYSPLLKETAFTVMVLPGCRAMQEFNK